MKRIYIFICLLFCGLINMAQTNPAPQALPYSQNFASFTGSASAYPAGWQGWTINGSTSTSYPTAVPLADQVLASGTASANSAVSAFVGDAVGKIAFLNTSAALKCFVLSVNTTGVSPVQVSYLAATQRQQLANRIGGMGLQYRVGNSSTFTDVAGSEYLNDLAADNITGTGSLNPQTKTVTLPAACNNQPEVQLRWVYREVSGAGNRPGFSVTNVVVNNGSAITPTLTTTGTISDFGNVVILTSSTSQSFSLSGTNLTGAPGNITIIAPSTDFQVSNNNSTWAASTTVPYTSATLAATPVYVRFTPQTIGFKSGNVSITGGGVSSAVTVAVSGTGVAPATPALSATVLAAFGNICVNTTVGPNSFTLSGSNLTSANITVGPLSGFSFSTASGGTYTASLSLTQPGGTYSQAIFVKFTPSAVQSYNGNIPVGGGGATSINVAASGAGANNPPLVTTGTASAITTTTATAAGTISSTGCTAITLYGIEYSTTNGFANGTGTQTASTNLSAGAFSSNLTGLLPSTTYYYKAYATNTGGTSYGTQQSFATLSPVLSATAITAFGTCINTTAGPYSFTLTGTNLLAGNITVGPLAGYTFSTSATGTYTASLSLSQTGGAYSQVIYVKFTPVAPVSYNGNIPVSGGGATAIVVAVSGTALNIPATVSTRTATVLSANAATLYADVLAIGCSALTEYGFEYSSISGFTNGYGTKVAASNLGGAAFSITANGLVQSGTYYYKAYVVNNGGISYGTEKTFKTKAIPAGLIIYSSPINRGGNIHYTLDNVKPGHYAARIYNSTGQLVFQRDIIMQVNFIDDNFTIPAKLGVGRYVLQITNSEFRREKPFMIR